jgi:hypothetical protein
MTVRGLAGRMRTGRRLERDAAAGDHFASNWPNRARVGEGWLQVSDNMGTTLPESSRVAIAPLVGDVPLQRSGSCLGGGRALPFPRLDT